jgi:hypothetical protein
MCKFISAVVIAGAFLLLQLLASMEAKAGSLPDTVMTKKPYTKSTRVNKHKIENKKQLKRRLPPDQLKKEPAFGSQLKEEEFYTKFGLISLIAFNKISAS